MPPVSVQLMPDNVPLLPHKQLSLAHTAVPEQILLSTNVQNDDNPVPIARVSLSLQRCWHPVRQYSYGKFQYPNEEHPASHVHPTMQLPLPLP